MTSDRYDRTLIRGIVLAAYTGWIAFSATHILTQAQMPPLGNPLVLNVISALVLLSSWLIFTVQHSSWSLYLYVCFPVYFWREAVAKCGGNLTGILDIQTVPGALKRLIQAALVVAALQSMVVRMCFVSSAFGTESNFGRLPIPIDRYGARASSSLE